MSLQKKTAAFIGSTQVLVGCLEQWLAQGGALHAVVSDCVELKSWASIRSIPVVSPKSDLVARLSGDPFDYLFSIVNHAILPDELLTLPTARAINYHDSPLPNYAGFNATAWAILDGASAHGVTWHNMTLEVDGGDILLQRTFEISPEDTAFSLGVKCANACQESFAELLAALAEEARSGTPIATKPQGPQAHFHRRSERPGLGLIDFERPANEIERFGRGLQFGTEDNWMCLPKIRLAGSVVLVDQIEIAREIEPGEPGQVIAVGINSISISARDAVLRLSGLRTLGGDEIQPSALGLAVGSTLPATREIETQLAEYDARLTKHERFWVRRIAAQRAPVLTNLRANDGPVDPAEVSAPRQYTASDYATALAIYITRSGESAEFDFAVQKDLPDHATEFYATATPMQVKIDPEAGISSAKAAIDEAFAKQDKRGTFARDLTERYAQTRAMENPPESLSIGLNLGHRPGLVATTALTLSVHDAKDNLALNFDQNAISRSAVEDILARVETLLAAAKDQPDAPVGVLDLLPELEKRKLLDLAQGPVKAYASDLCVHQQFEAQVHRTPDAIATVFGNSKLTYAQLNQRANQIAHSLAEKGVEAGDLVAVCLKRSTDLIAALLGVMKAGAAYVPMDPAYPRDRLSIMLEDSGAKVLLTQAALSASLSFDAAELVTLETIRADVDADAPETSVTSADLAYVIFTSGSTGRPKGVKVAHRNVSNFFAGMDDVIGTEPGVWLAVTSVSFDISVLEIFWTLSRGFEVIIQAESDRSSLTMESSVKVSNKPMDFGLFYFSSSQGDTRPGETYKLLLEGAKFADANGFQSVWTPERHFHEFGGIYPNPAVTTGALAAITENIALRAGSVVLPLHNPIRVTEDWSVLDQLSNGRVGLSFASGWHANDFAIMPENYERRRELMVESIETVFKLWAGEEVEVENGEGQMIKVSTFPRPIQARPPIWIASAGNVETFKSAGRLGANILTNMLGQDIEDLRIKLAAYRTARAEAGFDGPGQVSLMLHTYVCDDTEKAREIAREPFCNYLQSSFDLVKVAPWMFPAFKRSASSDGQSDLDASQFTDEDLAALMDHAFDRYFETAGLFGSPEKALEMVEKLKEIGVNEVACLVDFGIESDTVLENLPHLNRLRELANSATDSIAETDQMTVAETLQTHPVTHLQCTPSMARILIDDPDVLDQFGNLKHLMLGGEALPMDLAERLSRRLSGQFSNMYGPTETTIWSTTASVAAGQPVTIGRPIANTVIRLLDANHNMVALGAAGELCIGGDGVVPGYFGRDELTAERFVSDPYAPGQRLYKTGDLARYTPTGDIEYLGRIDQQVKINGYRIELGEIETQLSRHPDIWQSVVSAHHENGVAQLVAYYTTPPVQTESTDIVDHWKGLWDTAYQQSDSEIDPRFNFSGWNDSYTGTPIPENHMREWLDATQRNILDLNPARVLEVGCGTGMVLFSLLPEIEHYTATDLSPSALDQVGTELSAEEAARVTLLQMPAHAIGDLQARSFDTVIINSVAQYFPNAEYLKSVVAAASELVTSGGQIFLGDIRNLDLLNAFHSIVEVNQAPAQLDISTLSDRIQNRIERDSELVLAEDYFHALVRELPRLQGATVTLKRGQLANEMADFRYDVVLHIGEAALDTVKLPAPQHADSLDEVRRVLGTGDPVVYLQGLLNARLAPVFTMHRELAGDAPVSINDLRGLLEQDRIVGINPGDLFDIHPDYRAEIIQSRDNDPARMDVVFRREGRDVKMLLPHTQAVGSIQISDYANAPYVQPNTQDHLIKQVRDHLREHLPDYMMPSTFVLMDSFPLTPNGKVDRKALPAPKKATETVVTEYVPPSNDLEATIAGIWKEILGLSQVGRTDNIFDIGANSLLTAQANQRLSKALGKRVSLVSMFRYPTIETLADHLAAGTASPNVAPVAREAKTDRRAEAAAKRRAMRKEQLT